MIEFARFGNGSRRLIGLHGWFGDETTFAPLQLSLDPAVFDCVWLAHRGYGTSKEIGGRFDMAEMADDALAVADRLGWSNFDVIGHSMGGKAAQLVAARAPERVGKLVAVTPVAADPVPFDDGTRALFTAAHRDPDCRRTIVDFSTGGRLSPYWVDRVVGNSLARSTLESFGSYFRSWADDDLSDAIVSSDVATLAIAGAHDPTITTDFCRLGFARRYARLTIEEIDCGHYPMDEAPLIFGAMVANFLGS